MAHKNIKGYLFLLPVVTFVAALVNWYPVSAAVGDSTAPGAAGSCTNIIGFLNDGEYHLCSRLGVAWFYESKDPSTSHVNITGPGASSLECPGIDGYYRLSYLRTSLEGSESNLVFNYKGGTSYVYDGLLDVALAQSPNTILREDRNAVSWSTANAAFLVAESYGVTKTSWLETGAFCYDSSWDCPPGDPDCPVPPTPTPSTSNGHFWSKSKVEAVAGADVPSGIVATSTEDGTADIKFSTDLPSVRIKFTHTVGYTNETTFGASDVVDDADTTWNVYQSNSYGSRGNSIHTDTKLTATDGASTSSEVLSPTITVTLDPGQTKTVCQTVTYDPKYITYTKTAHYPASAYITGTSTLKAGATPDYYIYNNPTGSGNGQSSVCATVFRPDGPDTGDGTGGTGSTSSNVMFAGETADISWNVSGGSVDTRRLREWQAVVYRVNVNVLNSSSLYTGTRGNLQGSQSLNVCQWYSNHDYCNTLNGRSGSFGDSGQSHSYNESANIVVPDQVGYKYCNSFGYRYEYWWYSSSSGGDGWNFDKSYWRIQDASCRTIAKKPTVAIWNSNMMTAGGITTSSSPRFDNPIMGTESSAGGSKTLYGAWVEHLAAIGRNVTYFGSGSSFAIGSKNLAAPKSNPLTLDNSTLTISNNGKLGSSGIFNNSTYRTRLTTFLENQATRPGGSELGAMSNVSDTRILRYDGNLKITGNITIAPGPYNSIYHVPQVVIFVHGDLEIASDVTRIDAWLIVDGKINTCSEFQSGLTEADAISRLRDTCNKQLVFNGPVLANNLVLTRSFGADPLITRTGTFGTASTQQAAGEVFNLRADTYLWAYAQAGRYDSSYTESYTRELAPRY